MRANQYPGFYVVFDGIAGCGKSEQIRQLKTQFPRDYPELEVTFTYEPGGTPEADKLRQVLKHKKLSSRQEVELFAQSRKLSLLEVVRPALSRGEIVISDRSFTTSLSYQGVGRGFGVEEVWEINKSIVAGTFPDALFYLNVGLEASLLRSGAKSPDKFDEESTRFWERTAKGFKDMISFIEEISPNTKVIEIKDTEGKLAIEEMNLQIKKELYPMIDTWKREGRISREMQTHL